MLPKVEVRETGRIKIARSSGFLSFQAMDDNTRFIEAVKIDVENGVLVFINDTIPFAKQVDARSTPFDEWTGFSWKLLISNLDEEDDLKMDSLVSKFVEISFGRVKATGKILLLLK